MEGKEQEKEEQQEQDGKERRYSNSIHWLWSREANQRIERE